MLKRLILPLLFGIAGFAVLAGLGTWQMQRLAWKEGVLAEIAAGIAAPPVALPEGIEPARDAYLPVRVAGRLTGQGVRVLASVKGIGPGHRLIGVLETGPEAAPRRVLVDLGFVPLDGDLTQPQGPVTITGNLHWPDEINRNTPAPEADLMLWFARDIDRMSVVLATEPVLVVARDPVRAGAIPIPVDTAHIPNDHLGYAITWFGLAAVWAGMTIFLLWRITRRRF